MSSLRQTIRSMVPGDSLVFRPVRSEALSKTRSRAMATIRSMREDGKLPAVWRFVTREMDGVIRMWRIADAGSRIEKGVPIPRARLGTDLNRGSKYGFDHVEVGESFTVPADPSVTHEALARRMTANAAYHTRRRGHRFTVKRADGGTVVVSRVA